MTQDERAMWLMRDLIYFKRLKFLHGTVNLIKAYEKTVIVTCDRYNERLLVLAPRDILELRKILDFDDCHGRRLE